MKRRSISLYFFLLAVSLTTLCSVLAIVRHLAAHRAVSIHVQWYPEGPLITGNTYNEPWYSLSKVYCTEAYLADKYENTADVSVFFLMRNNFHSHVDFDEVRLEVIRHRYMRPDDGFDP